MTAYGVTAVLLAAFNAPVRALVWVALGLIGAVMLMYFLAAVGIWCSVRFKNSWQSLLATLLLGYSGGFILALVGLPVVMVLTLMVMLVLALLAYIVETITLIPVRILTPTLESAIYHLLCGVGLFAVFRAVSQRFLSDARLRIARQDRTPYWKEGINCTFMVEQYLSQYESKHA